MPKATYARCRNCGATREEAGEMSHTRLCPTCSVEELRSNIEQMVDRRGPNFDKWRRSMVLCAYPGLLDALNGAP